MDRIRRAALLTRLVERLRQRGSWCGETHVQKATLFLQYLTDVPLGFDFVLYKHGPFSFDLRDELTSMRADELLKLEPHMPYGPRIGITDRSKYIQKFWSKTLGQYENSIEFVSDKLGSKGVTDLERLATAFYLTQQVGVRASVEKRARQLAELKPHVSLESAREAVCEVDEIAADWAAR